MMNRAPSVKRLAAFYPTLDRPTILKVRKALVLLVNPLDDPDRDPYLHPSFRRDELLKVVSDLVGAHGVEYMAVDGDIRGDRGILYVNEGDSWRGTVLYDNETGTVRLQSTGDCQMVYERRGRRF